jgi:DNA-binding transcriptional LysR family regulator
MSAKIPCNRHPGWRKHTDVRLGEFRHSLAVARAGTLSGAARALHVDHATVSRRLIALEAELQAALVKRLPHCCRLTPMGVHLYEHAKAMEAAAFTVERLTRSDHAPLTGTVTPSAPPVLVTHLLAQRLPDFRSNYPGIRLSVLAQAQQVSLSRREADVALRLLRPTEVSSVVRKLAQMPFARYARGDYAAAHRPEDWTFIAYDAQLADVPQQQWLLDIAGKRTVGCELSDMGSHLVAARAGAGVAGLTCFLGDADPAMLRLEHTGSMFSRDIWLVVHRDLRRAAPVRAVMDFVAAAVAATPGLGLEPPVAKRPK